MPLETMKGVIVMAGADENLNAAYKEAFTTEGFSKKAESASGGSSLYVRR